MKTVHPIGLMAKAGNWRLYTIRKADPAFRKFAEKVLIRDGYTCQFCSFQAHDFQEVVNLDHNYRNNRLSNLATACCFCAQCFFLESVGVGDYGGGTLIYLPEISQAELNSFCHVLFCAIANDAGYKTTAQSIYRGFKFRAQDVEKKFSEGACEPSVFGQMLIESNLNEVEIGDLLRDIRLLPSRGRFKHQIERWAASALEALSSSDF